MLLLWVPICPAPSVPPTDRMAEPAGARPLMTAAALVWGLTPSKPSSSASGAPSMAFLMQLCRPMALSLRRRRVEQGAQEHQHWCFSAAQPADARRKSRSHKGRGEDDRDHVAAEDVAHVVCLSQAQCAGSRPAGSTQVSKAPSGRCSAA
jgi:hypothetical protein